MTRITVRVTPRASSNEVHSWDGDVLRIRVAAPPADGKANKAVVSLLGRTLGVPRSKIRIVSGATSRTKVITIDGLSLTQLRTLIQAAS
jgi:uncharacterized protein (TIGR00251 family)